MQDFVQSRRIRRELEEIRNLLSLYSMCGIPTLDQTDIRKNNSVERYYSVNNSVVK
jgi:hypothetical protein